MRLSTWSTHMKYAVSGILTLDTICSVLPSIAVERLAVDAADIQTGSRSG